MAPAVLAALIAAVPAMAQIGMGVKQRNEAKKLASQSPEYETPQEVEDIMRSARKQARDRNLPGTDLIEQSIGSSTGRGAAAIKNTSGSSVDSLAAITALYGMEQDRKIDLGIESARNYNRNQDVMRDALALGAGYRDKEFDFNAWQPWMAASAAASAMRGAGQQNMMRGATNLSTLASGYMQRKSAEGAPSGSMMSQQDSLGPVDRDFEYFDEFDRYMNDPTIG